MKAVTTSLGCAHKETAVEHAHRRVPVRRVERSALPSETMRAGSIVMFGRLIGVTGLGAYLGAALAGLIAVITGQAFAAPWPAAVPVLAVLGGAVGAAVSWLTRRWFAPRLRHRFLVLSGAGIPTLPLAVAIGQFHAIASVDLLLIFLGGATTLIIYLRASHAAAGRAR